MAITLALQRPRGRSGAAHRRREVWSYGQEAYGILRDHLGLREEKRCGLP
ncbi:hypothetical protein AB0F92_33505 [Kitasatospora aureofaciens]|nr:hypothetical protein [Kitasatospora aureofaciens]